MVFVYDVAQFLQPFVLIVAHKRIPVPVAIESFPTDVVRCLGEGNDKFSLFEVTVASVAAERIEIQTQYDVDVIGDGGEQVAFVNVLVEFKFLILLVCEGEIII